MIEQGRWISACAGMTGTEHGEEPEFVAPACTSAGAQCRFGRVPKCRIRPATLDPRPCGDDISEKAPHVDHGRTDVGRQTIRQLEQTLENHPL